MRKPIESDRLNAARSRRRWVLPWLGLAFLLGCAVPLFSSGSARPAVTAGLIHYWPDLWDAYDEVTGREGVIMAVLPPAAENGPDATPFHDETGWVQLPVRLRMDQAWTLSFWMRPGRPVHAGGTVVALHSREQQWGLLETEPGPQPRYQWMARGPRFDHGPELQASFDKWQHVVISKSDGGQVTAWLNGVGQGQTQLSFPPDLEVEWIVAGNDLKGDTQYFGHLRDLGLFDRVLSEPEVQALHAAGRSDQPARPSAARRAALRNPTAVVWSTNVVHRSVASFAHRRYTAEDGLPQNRVQCLLQTREGYLWVGTEAGPARFDGSRFRAFDEDNTPALAQADLDFFSFAETDDGTVWAGTHTGLLRIRDTQFTAVTQGLPERFILLLAPAGEDALWVAAFRDDRHYRGPCRVRRYHPGIGRSTAEVVVPGQVRRMVPAEDGLWLATEQPEMILFWDLEASAPTVVARPGGSPLTALVLDGAERAGGVRLRGWFDPQQPSRRVLEFTVGKDAHRFHWIGPAYRSAANASRWSVSQNPDSWLGAEPGLAQIDADRLDLIDFRELPTAPEVLCLSPNREGGFWVGTAGEGLHLFRERLVEVSTARDGLSGNDVRSVLATSEGTVLAGGPAGLDEFRDGRWTRRGTEADPPLASVISLAQDVFGTIWVGGGGAGIDALGALAEDVRWDLSLGGVDWQHPNTLASTPQGRLWVGCNRGITWVEPGGPPAASDLATWRSQIRHRRFRIGDDLPDAVFLKLLPDRDGSLWVGSLGRGLLRGQDQRVERFTTEDGLPNDIIVPAHIDESGALWLTTKGAVSLVSADRVRFRHRLDGYDADWSAESDMRLAYYTNLRPGT